MFVFSTTWIGLEQEPPKGKTEPEYFNTDITDIKWLTSIVSCLTLVCSAVLLACKVLNLEDR
jgi:hypothetical protein